MEETYAYKYQFLVRHMAYVTKLALLSKEQRRPNSYFFLLWVNEKKWRDVRHFSSVIRRNILEQFFNHDDVVFEEMTKIKAALLFLFIIRNGNSVIALYAN